ncbi:MAG: hypothetical protein EBU09_05180 [Betaproteobacteria bacterium]|nr:hypothetical protein [Betaproteobacteria bacterium]
MEILRRGMLLAGTASGLVSSPAAKATKAALASASRLIHQQASMFGPIVVTEEPGGLRTLRFGLDGPRQSVVKLNDPRYLELRYTQAAILALAFVPSPQRILMIGLGGGSLPMFVAKRFLNFREDERMRAYARDGRNFIEGAKLSYDIIMLDAFSAEAVPKHLSTTEFLQAVKKVLAVNGVVVANLWGPALNPLYDSMLRTFQDVFSDLYLLEVPEVENRLMFALPRRIDLRMATFREHAHNTSLVLGLPFDLALMIGTGFYRIDKPITKGRVLRD